MIQGFNDLDECDLRKLIEDGERQPSVTHRGERDPRSISSGWLTWLAKKMNLATKDELMNEAEALQKLKDEVAKNRAAVAGALGALKVQITELKTQLTENPNSSTGILELCAQIEQDTADLQASQSPLPPVDNPTISEAD